MDSTEWGKYLWELNTLSGLVRFSRLVEIKDSLPPEDRSLFLEFVSEHKDKHFSLDLEPPPLDHEQQQRWLLFLEELDGLSGKVRFKRLVDIKHTMNCVEQKQFTEFLQATKAQRKEQKKKSERKENTNKVESKEELVAGDSVAKNPVSKDPVSKDPVSKDLVSKDPASKDAVENNSGMVAEDRVGDATGTASCLSSELVSGSCSWSGDSSGDQVVCSSRSVFTNSFTFYKEFQEHGQVSYLYQDDDYADNIVLELHEL
eukprot:CAMPEP_0174252492 /NCGR_PEP_ID=MMETSP0439-20130205/1940_1 /TAXON_ID=0 /ORGANISM="Stereomyxa ramosa, Strain Chinc5" /LENGTH=258 /DNA_ID=CAMNT_0015333037 /DNA_START=50 /DNA_END=826 /DNA_ORIENTATION=-